MNRSASFCMHNTGVERSGNDTLAFYVKLKKTQHLDFQVGKIEKICFGCGFSQTLYNGVTQRNSTAVTDTE